MIKDIIIKNFKSIVETSISLGNVNVFIGANGAGKSNILEAIAMAASERSCIIEVKDMIQKGIRISKPELMVSSFYGKQSPRDIIVKFSDQKHGILNLNIYNQTPADIYSNWGATISSRVHRPEFSEEVTRGMVELQKYLSQYLIYSPSVNTLRGLTSESFQYPLGIYGEGLDVLLNQLPKEEIEEIKQTAAECIPWIEDIFFDSEELYKMQGYKLGRSKSNLYFRDKFMQRKNNLFSAENANEGVLVLLFFLTLFISHKTPNFFAVDNIENGLNPRLCRFLMKNICSLSKKNNKQVIITTHNPAILDGLNLNDEAQRLYVVQRNDEGQTQIKRIRTKPTNAQMRISEMWMRGLIGGVSDNF